MVNVYRQVRRCVLRVTCCFCLYSELAASSNLVLKENQFYYLQIKVFFIFKNWGWRKSSVFNNTCWLGIHRTIACGNSSCKPFFPSRSHHLIYIKHLSRTYHVVNSVMGVRNLKRIVIPPLPSVSLFSRKGIWFRFTVVGENMCSYITQPLRGHLSCTRHRGKCQIYIVLALQHL